MTGGGFGGCTINLVARERAQQFSEQIRQSYQEVTHLRPEIYITKAAQGAGPAI
jgi:galactokinase